MPGAQAGVARYAIQVGEWSAWDKVSLNGQVLPGICRLKVPPIMVRLDTKKQPGFNGTPITPLGLVPAIIDLEIRFMDFEWDDVQIWIDLLWTKPTKKWQGAGTLQKLKGLTDKQAQDVVPVWDISHPMLAGSNVDKVVVVGYTPPDDDGTPQRKIVKFKLHQWSAAAAKAPSKPRPQAGRPVVQPFRLDQTTPANQAASPPSKTDTKRR